MHSLQADPSVKAASGFSGIGSGFLVSIVVLIIIIILVVREIVTWYWKINRIVDLLEDLNYETRRIYHVLAGQQETPVLQTDLAALTEPPRKEIQETHVEGLIASSEALTTEPEKQVLPPAATIPWGERLTLEGFSWKRVGIIAGATSVALGLSFYLVFLR